MTGGKNNSPISTDYGFYSMPQELGQETAYIAVTVRNDDFFDHYKHNGDAKNDSYVDIEILNDETCKRTLLYSIPSLTSSLRCHNKNNPEQTLNTGFKLFEEKMPFFNMPCATKKNVDDIYSDLCKYLYYQASNVQMHNSSADEWSLELLTMNDITDTLYLQSVLALKREILHSIGFPVLGMKQENLNKIKEIKKLSIKTSNTKQKRENKLSNLSSSNENQILAKKNILNKDENLVAKKDSSDTNNLIPKEYIIDNRSNKSRKSPDKEGKDHSTEK